MGRITKMILNGDYPAYDKEMIARKIRAVCGKFETGMTISERQWEQVMELCRIEWEFLGRDITPRRVLDQRNDVAESAQHRLNESRYKGIELK